MLKPIPLKVEFIDKDTMCVVEDLHNIFLNLNDDSTITAWHTIGENAAEYKELEVRVR